MDKSTILAIVQGLTEFLPVSSSGHLVIFNRVFSMKADLLFYTVLHLGTMFSLIVFFFKDIIKVLKNLDLLKKILIITLVTGAVGFVGEGFFESLFSYYKFVIVALFVNGLILIFANRRINAKEKSSPTYLDSLILGLTQSIAIIPGISRSGITISTLLFRGINKEEAFRFSFLASIPIIFGSFLFEIREGVSLSSLFKYGKAFILAFITGYLALLLLHLFIERARLDIFGYYCIIIAFLWLAVLS